MIHGWLCWLAVACSSPNREGTPALVGSATPVDAQPAVDAALLDADLRVGYPPTIDRGETPCVLRSTTWRDQPSTLSLVASGKHPYADVHNIKQATVWLGAGAFVELASESMRLVGYVPAKQLVLHAGAPFIVGGFAAPGPQLPLRFVAARGDRATIQLRLPPYAKLVAPLIGEQPCADLAVDDAADFDARDAIDEESEREAYLHARRAIPLRIEPEKPPVVVLRYDSVEAVEVLATKDKLARVVIAHNALNPAYHVVLFGWIPASALHDRGAGFGGSWGSGGDRGIGRGPPMQGWSTVVCAHEVPLAVELSGERRTVGAVLPNAVIEVAPGDDDFAEVRLARPTAELARGARWLVKRTVLADCGINSRHESHGRVDGGRSLQQGSSR